MTKPKKKTHHYIPRFLLKGFASRTETGRKGTRHFVHLYTRGQGARELPISSIAHEKYFHGNTGDGGLEDVVASHEQGYANVIAALRRGELEGLPKALIAEVVAHFCIRTRNVRDGLANAGAELVRIATEEFVKDENRPQVQRELMRVLVEEELDRPEVAQLIQLLGPNGREIFLRMAEAKMTSPEFHAAMSSTVSEFAKAVSEGKPFNGIAKDAQIRAMSAGVAPAKRVEFFSSFNWTLLTQKVGAFILGDTIVVGLTGNEFGHPFRHEHMESAVCLPVASDKLLVGYREGLPPDVEIDRLNIAAAELSQDFFVSATASSREDRYAGHLGARAQLLGADEAADLRGQLFQE